MPSSIYYELLKFAGIDHIQARGILTEAFRNVMGREPSVGEIQGAQSVAWLETQYGNGWKGAGVGSNNWGAIQCCQPDKSTGQCPANTFMYTDTKPQSDGSSKKYSVCFKKYNTPLDGAIDLIKTLYKSNVKGRSAKLIDAAQSGSVNDFSQGLYESGYYEGFGKTKEDRVNNHVKSMNNAMDKFTVALNEDKSLQRSDSKMQFNDPATMQQVEQEYNDLMRQLVASVRNNNFTDRTVILLKLAGKIDDLKLKYPRLEKEINELKDTVKPKYIEWTIKQIADGANKNDIITSLSYFDRNIHKFENKDINSYTAKELENEIKEIAEKNKSKSENKNIAKAGAKKIYEDNEYVVVRPDNKDSCMVYGNKTKWCITMKDHTYYEQYSLSNVIFYFILRKNEKDNFDKIAYSVKRDLDNKPMQIEIFDSLDNGINQTIVDENIGAERGSKILGAIYSDAPTAPESDFVKLSKGTLSQDKMIPMINHESYLIRYEVAQQIDSEHLLKMIEDEDPLIRHEVAKRIAPEYLPEMLSDPATGVREALAKRIDSKYLSQMMTDEDVNIRHIVAKRIAPEHLVQMLYNEDDEDVKRIAINRMDLKDLPDLMNDESSIIRWSVAKRIELEYLPDMMNDQNHAVREVVAIRINPKYLPEMMGDEEATVREIVAERIAPKYLPEMMNDNSSEIREMVNARINRLKQSSSKNKLVKKADLPTYTESLRKLRKSGDKETLLQFQKVFKKTFDDAWCEGLENPEKYGLMAALREIHHKGII